MYVNFNGHFNITAKYRIKRSGFSATEKSRHNLIKENISKSPFFINGYRKDGDKLFVSSSPKYS